MWQQGARYEVRKTVGEEEVRAGAKTVGGNRSNMECLLLSSNSYTLTTTISILFVATKIDVLAFALLSYFDYIIASETQFFQHVPNKITYYKQKTITILK